MTTCAATMQADVIAVARLGWAAASFWPTSGSNGALAKWNSMTPPPKITSGRRCTERSEPAGPRRISAGSRSRARSWSMAAAGIDRTATARQQGDGRNDQEYGALIIEEADSAGDQRRDDVAGMVEGGVAPHAPSERAYAHRKTERQRADRRTERVPSDGHEQVAITTGQNVGARRCRTRRGPMRSKPRRSPPAWRGVTSINAPIGDWQAIASSPLTVVASPTSDWLHCCWVTRNTLR